MLNQEFAEELQKPIIRRFEKRKLCPPFTDNIWGADLSDIQLISKSNERIRFFVFVIDICSKCAWVIPLKGKKSIAVTNAVQIVLDESNRKPNRIWVDKGSEFYNRSME